MKRKRVLTTVQERIDGLHKNCLHLYGEAVKSDSPEMHKIYFGLISKFERELKTLTKG